MIDCHYRRLAADGEFLVFESTDGTRSNWDPEIQHGSPPLALMTKLIEERAGPIEERAGDSGLRIARLTLDILGAIPVTRLRLRSWVERPGARISLMAAEMLAPRPDGGERAVARVTAWLRCSGSRWWSIPPTAPVRRWNPEKFVFMNTDTVMHLHRLPAGNDFALRARGSIGPDGIGVTTADIFDRQGLIGTSAQTLLVQRRP